ncbi:MAG: hypothetical protein ACI80V_000896 [Rhodothermales bacterium]|jgi:hypothetical protein
MAKRVCVGDSKRTHCANPAKHECNAQNRRHFKVTIRGPSLDTASTRISTGPGLNRMDSIRSLATSVTAALIMILVTPVSAQEVPALLRGSVETDSRAVRRDVPLTQMIRRALESGTRDFTGRPGANYWQLEADYDIEVSLNPSTQRLAGSETITLHNNSPEELTEVYLRLDHNVFRDDVPRGTSVPAEETEGMVLTSLTVNGAKVDLHARPPARRRGGSEGSASLSVSGLEDTVARILLSEPIPAHGTASLEIEWHTKLPGSEKGQGHRMTQRWGDTLFQPTQWFPRIAKYDDLGGWWTDLYLGPAEFYNNFGRFDVKINVPGGWIVSGTGTLQNPEEVLTADARVRLKGVLVSDQEIMIVDESEPKTAEGESLTWHFTADKVNDFAWATADDFVWRATRATIPETGPVPIHMVYRPERAEFFVEAGTRTRHALEFYSALWAPYPFPQLTLQDGPSAGMEYPMVINSNQGAADHETAHQWWPMTVGTNETWYGWMDEGFNSYMNILSGADSRGEEPRLDGLGLSYGRTSGDEAEPPMMWQANYGGDLYRFQTYRKAPLMLSMLGGIVGDAEVQRAMSAYTHAWAFKHPSPWDFAFFMSNELGVDLGWFWYYWLWTTDSVEGSIQSVDVTGTRAVVNVRQAGQMPAPIVLRVELEPSGSDAPLAGAQMLDANTGLIVIPVDVWFGGNKNYQATIDLGGRTLERVVPDPGCRFPDSQPADNVWPIGGGSVCGG